MARAPWAAPATSIRDSMVRSQNSEALSRACVKDVQATAIMKLEGAAASAPRSFDADLRAVARVGHGFLGRSQTVALACLPGNARWAALDRRVLTDAPAVPLIDRANLLLVSDRVGNAQTHLQLGPLLDQFWVR